MAKYVDILLMAIFYLCPVNGLNTIFQFILIVAKPTFSLKKDFPAPKKIQVLVLSK